MSKSEPQFPWNIMQSLQSRNSAFISVVVGCFFTPPLLALMGRKYLKTCHLTTEIMCKSSFHKRQYWQCCNILPATYHTLWCHKKSHQYFFMSLETKRRQPFCDRISLPTAKIAPEKQGIHLTVYYTSLSMIFSFKNRWNFAREIKILLY